MSTDKSDSNQITREYFDSILIEARYIDSDLPSMETEFFGKKYKTPVMTAALSHLHNVIADGMEEFAAGARDAGALHFVGMGEDDELERIIATGADTVKIIKPHLDNAVVFHKIEHAVSHGAVAVGMDIDHAYASDGAYDNVMGLPMKPKSLEELKEFISFAKVPFVIKGVLSVQDAVKAKEAGAKAIIVSHHHGIMPYSVPPLMVLPEIVRACEGEMGIIVDCGIESGADAFKALALGADAVALGRALMGPLKNGRAGVTETIDNITAELRSIMARTGAKSVKDIDPGVLHFTGRI